jgi:excisionase family DNA binding protein
MKNGTVQVFLTPKEIAAEMGIDLRHFWRKLARGEGPKYKRYGARYLIRKDWYEKWLNGSKSESVGIDFSQKSAL